MGVLARAEAGGWPDDVVGPSAEPYNSVFPIPRALTVAEIKDIVKAFVDAAKRALKAGVDVIEIHNAHGYLLHRLSLSIIGLVDTLLINFIH